MSRARLFTAVVLICALAATAAVHAQPRDWPTKPVRMIVTFPPGGASDVVARLLAPRLAGGGPQWLVDNRPGGDGMIGAEAVAKAAADGYTLLVANVGPQAIAPALHAKARYDPIRDFAFIAHIGANAHVLLVTPSFPPRSVKEYVALAKARPGEIDFGAGGPINQLTGELLKAKAGVRITYVPYKGAALVVQDLRGGQIPSAVAPLPGNVGHIRSGALRALAVTSQRRSTLAPDIPTFVEQGYREIVVENWIGFAGPANLPPEIVARIASGVQQALEHADTRAKLDEIGVTPRFLGANEFSRYVETEARRWRQIVLDAGAKAQ